MARNQHATFKRNSQFSCISPLPFQLSCKLSCGSVVVPKRPAAGLPVLYIFPHLLARELRPATKSEGGHKPFMKNLPNSTQTQENFNTAYFCFQLGAFMKRSQFVLNHCSHIKLRYLHINKTPSFTKLKVV